MASSTRALSEFSRLFQGNPRPAARGLRITGGRGITWTNRNHNSRLKRTTGPYTRQVYLNLFCLSSTDATCVPGAEMKMNLVFAVCWNWR